MNKLTPDQRRFAIIGGASLLAVGIMLFLIQGLSGVSFSADKEARFERDLAKKEKAAIDVILDTEYERYAFILAAVEQYGEDSLFGLDADTRQHFVRDVTDFARTQVEVTPPTVEDYEVSVPEDIATACTMALEHEQDAIETFTKEIDRVGPNQEVVTVLRVLRDQSEQTYVPAFQDCE